MCTTSTSITITALSAIFIGLTVSFNAICSDISRYICQDSTFGDCCSSAGFCDSTVEYCSSECQSGFGMCTTPASITAAASPASITATAPSATSTSLTVSLDATCGDISGYTCQELTFGDCCLFAGFCDSTVEYCDPECQSDFGTCTMTASITATSPSAILTTVTPPAATPTTATSPAATPTCLTVSPDATCGGTTGHICQGSTFGVSLPHSLS